MTGVQTCALPILEALAAGEDYVPIQCIGTGTVDCPLGGKTKFVMIGYSLE